MLKLPFQVLNVIVDRSRVPAAERRSDASADGGCASALDPLNAVANAIGVPIVRAIPARRFVLEP